MVYDKVVDSEKLDGAMKSTADAIREKTGTSELIEWDKNNGFKDSVEGVFDAGKKAEYEEFWDNAIQEKTLVVEGIHLFAGGCWNDKTFKPPKKITLTKKCNYSFYDNRVTDISPYVIFEGVESLNSAFQYSKTIKIPYIDASNVSTLSSTFANSQVGIIEGLKVSATTKYSYAFSSASKLVHVIFDGTIAQNGLNFIGCPLLDKESITKVINILSTETSGLTVSFSKTSVAKAFETTEGANDGISSQEWNELIAPHSNWTISLS